LGGAGTASAACAGEAYPKSRRLRQREKRLNRSDVRVSARSVGEPAFPQKSQAGN